MNVNFFTINILLPVLSIIIPVFATVYTVNKRIKVQTRENHQPHVVLEKVESIEKVNPLKYYLTLVGRNYCEAHQDLSVEQMAKLEKDNLLSVDLRLKNIGYGVATNIKFYNLLTGHQIYGSQESSKDCNQRLFTTLDIGSNEEKIVPAKVISLIKEEEEIIKEDHNRILCVYKDLNNNVDSFIITINVKGNLHYDFFAYQPSSISYRKWIRENKKQYKSIIKRYINL